MLNILFYRPITE